MTLCLYINFIILQIKGQVSFNNGFRYIQTAQVLQFRVGELIKHQVS